MRFIAAMEMVAHANDSIYAKNFVRTLTGPALNWFWSLTDDSIGSTQQLLELFRAKFAINTRPPQTLAALLKVKRFQGEKLRAFMERFNEVANQIDITLPQRIRTLRDNLGPHPLKRALIHHTPKNEVQLLEMIGKHVEEEDEFEGLEQPRPPTYKADRPQKQTQEYERTRTERSESPDAIHVYESLAENEGSKTPYCEFHERPGHNTRDCRSFLKHIKERVGKRKAEAQAARPHKKKSAFERLEPATYDLRQQLTKGDEREDRRNPRSNRPEKCDQRARSEEEDPDRPQQNKKKANGEGPSENWEGAVIY